MRRILGPSRLSVSNGQAYSSEANTNRKLLTVQVPQALHEQLVISWHAVCRGKPVRSSASTVARVEIEENVVEEGEFVVHRHGGFTDLLVKLAQGIFRLWRVHFA